MFCNKFKIFSGQTAYFSGICDLSWFPGSTQIVSGGAQTTLDEKLVKIWNVETDGSIKLLQDFDGHTFSVKSVDVNPHDPRKLYDIHS